MDDGASLRTHLESVERQTGRRPERLDTEPIPVEFGWHYGTWVDLSAGRTQNGMGAAPLSWLDIHAYSMLFKITFTRLDIMILRLMDAAYFSAQAEERERTSKPDK